MCKKKKFSEFEAKLAVFMAKSSRKNRRKEKRYYWCRFCKAYHLTSRENA